MSIWEVRNTKLNFTYSKIMLWVAFDRGLRLADKRCLPCPHRYEWMATKDEIYETIMEKGYSKTGGCFVQSFENREEGHDILDSSILVAPLVFFITANDPRFLRTMDKILLSPDKGGLTSTGLVYRYNTELSEDGSSPSAYPTPFPSSLLIPNPLRSRRSRRRLQHVHILACRSSNQSRSLRQKIPQPSNQHF